MEFAVVSVFQNDGKRLGRSAGNRGLVLNIHKTRQRLKGYISGEQVNLWMKAN